ncbi:MAG: hypothetical protein SGPRY_005428 [Prymnesium sp.]
MAAAMLWVAVAFGVLIDQTDALEAKWTPAKDGGSARFSKRYRDAQGIDDTRWGGGEAENSGFRDSVMRMLPDSPLGWIVAVAAALVCLFLARSERAAPLRTSSVTCGGVPTHGKSAAILLGTERGSLLFF